MLGKSYRQKIDAYLCHLQKKNVNIFYSEKYWGEYVSLGTHTTRSTTMAARTADSSSWSPVAWGLQADLLMLVHHMAVPGSA